ncbi:MAG: radical SAM family heme chaperone HemW [Candidatus Zixiibacteriota bacterium]|nr:MAG: radical SAM family heme chaperone HemW [candidate division Zixibacteria bacterium]
MGLSLYIHFPLCSNLCSYCDFYKEIYEPELEKRYFRALKQELLLALDTLESDNRILETIYIGGGTPSLVTLPYLEQFLSALREEFSFSDEVEFSFEINPDSIDSDRLLRLRGLGINRPIFGIQSFNSRHLKLLNRKHSLSDSFRAVYLARATGFANFGIDMIFGMPRQTARHLSDDLDQVINLAPSHISYYQLTVEENTVLARKVASGMIKLPGSDLSAAMYRAINEEFRKHQYFRYEVSSFAHPGFECRHNLRYWEGGDFLGLGPSAHSFIGTRRFANVADLHKYIDTLSEKRRPLLYDTDEVGARMTEIIMLGLRTTRGLSRQAFRRRFGIPVEQSVNREMLDLLVHKGMIDPGGDHIRLSESGLLVADDIIRRLIK